LHYGGQLAAPVFKEIATKLYAQYVKGKKSMPYQIIADSSNYTYAGFTPDVKNIFAQMNVNPEDSAGQNNWSSIYHINYKPVIKSENISKNIMPDVKNMTLKDALYLLENMNIKVLVKGKGKVVAQDVLAGTTIKKDQTIMLLLN
jgi:cell division protein FtsI (penicillin-binding protein 3)